MPSPELRANGRMWPSPKRDAIGRKVKTLRPMSTMQLTVPEGTILEVIDYKTTEVTLGGDACDCCGVRVYIRGVSIYSVLLLEQYEIDELERQSEEKRSARQPRMVVPKATTTRRPRDGSTEGL